MRARGQQLLLVLRAGILPRASQIQARVIFQEREQCLVGERGLVHHRLVPPRPPKHVDPQAVDQQVEPATSGESVIVLTAYQAVVAAAAEEAIVVFTAPQHVITTASVQAIAPRISEELVPAGMSI
jgi:hypothetical protein